MDIVDEVIRFFKSLVRQRVSRVQNQVRAKTYSAQARAKGKAAAAFNNAVDGSIDKAKKKATGHKPQDPNPQGGPPQG